MYNLLGPSLVWCSSASRYPLTLTILHLTLLQILDLLQFLRAQEPQPRLDLPRTFQVQPRRKEDDRKATNLSAIIQRIYKRVDLTYLKPIYMNCNPQSNHLWL